MVAMWLQTCEATGAFTAMALFISDLLTVISSNNSFTVQGLVLDFESVR